MREFTCIVCPKGCVIYAEDEMHIKGAGCERGVDYVKNEMKNPLRMVTSTVRIKGALLPLLPVKTSAPIKKNQMLAAVRKLDSLVVQAPVVIGDVVLRDVLGTGVDFIATKSAHKQEDIP